MLNSAQECSEVFNSLQKEENNDFIQPREGSAEQRKNRIREAHSIDTDGFFSATEKGGWGISQ